MVSNISRRSFVKLGVSAATSISLGHLIGREARGTTLVHRTVDMVDHAAIHDFTAALQGQVIAPGDPLYDMARRVWNTKYDRYPGIIARCANATDITRAVEFARSENLLVAVRSGGHSGAGHSTCDGGLVIDLAEMTGMEVDKVNRIARVQTGLLCAYIDAISAPHGLAMVLAAYPTVGLGGFTLGGGEGLLQRKYGLACDNLISAEVVLADGRLVTASAQTNPDLYWGIRGGGGNFGVVTSMQCRLHPVKRLISGVLLYGIAQMPEVLRRYRDFELTAPDEVVSGMSFSNSSDGPVLVIFADYVGDPGKAESALAPLRAIGKPFEDTIGPRSYLEVQGSSVAVGGMPGLGRGGRMPVMTDETIDLISTIAAEAPLDSAIDLFYMGGAPSRVARSATAYPHRDADFDIIFMSRWPNATQKNAAIEWVLNAWEAVSPCCRGVYVNALENEGQERVKEAYMENYSRLVKLKQKYDSDNFFRLNQNINPAA